MANQLAIDYVSPLPPVRSGIADYSLDLLPNLEKLWEYFWHIRMISQQACLATEKWASPLHRLSFSFLAMAAYRRGDPWILRHLKSGIEYVVASYRGSDGMFLMPVEDGAHRAIPMQHVLDGYYALWAWGG
jgi:hypothetical protein